MKVPCNYPVSSTCWALVGKNNTENLPGSKRKPAFLLRVIFSITELNMIYSLREIFPP